MGQPRPKFARIGNGVRTYDPAKAGRYKADIRAQVLSKPHSIMEGPLVMICEFYMMHPKAHYNTKGLKNTAPLWHEKKPDLDNMIKAVKDALKGIVWRDDSQVCSLYASKKYREAPGILIVVQDIP